MAGHRRDKINGQLTQEMAAIIRTVKDPRVSGALVTITGADCTPDLKYAKIYYSAIGSEKELDELRRGLKSANGYMRSQVAQRLNLRITPELQFIFDDSAQNASHIAALLHSVEDELIDFERREAEEAASAAREEDTPDDHTL